MIINNENLILENIEITQISIILRNVVYMCVRTCICLYICTYVCTYVLYIYICTYIFILFIYFYYIYFIINLNIYLHFILYILFYWNHSENNIMRKKLFSLFFSESKFIRKNQPCFPRLDLKWLFIFKRNKIYF